MFLSLFFLPLPLPLPLPVEIYALVVLLMVVVGGSNLVSLRVDLDPRRLDLSLAACGWCRRASGCSSAAGLLWWASGRLALPSPALGRLRAGAAERSLFGFGN